MTAQRFPKTLTLLEGSDPNDTIQLLKVPPEIIIDFHKHTLKEEINLIGSKILELNSRFPKSP